MEALVDVRLGAFPETLSDLPPASAALVVADPPFDDLIGWSETGRFARRVLASDGILLGYIGNRWCFEAINLLSANLTPVRLAFLPAQHEDAFDSTTNCLEHGSFMVVMSNGEFFPPGTWQNAVESEVRGHRWHPFQRPLANVMHYVEAFTHPGDLVVDPFLGSGTTALACLRLGRRFIGCDVDPEAVLATNSRVEAFTRTEEVGDSSSNSHERREAMASHEDQLWNEVNGILEARSGWSVQESPTPAVGPYWAFMTQGRVDRSIFIDGSAVHLYEEDADREVRFDTTEELVAWLDANRTLGPAPTTPKSDPLHWR